MQPRDDDTREYADPRYVLFCTDGARLDGFFWSRYGSRDSYSLLRQEEARLALSHLGVSKVEFLKTRSGESIIDQQVFQRLPEAVQAVFPSRQPGTPTCVVNIGLRGRTSRPR